MIVKAHLSNHEGNPLRHYRGNLQSIFSTQKNQAHASSCKSMNVSFEEMK